MNFTPVEKGRGDAGWINVMIVVRIKGVVGIVRQLALMKDHILTTGLVDRVVFIPVHSPRDATSCGDYPRTYHSKNDSIAHDKWTHWTPQTFTSLFDDRVSFQH
jgi:hypothetical protein